MQRCNPTRLDGSSPQQAAGDCILWLEPPQPWPRQPAGLAKPQADDFERRQARQHCVQARRVKWCVDESNLKAREATQVTDACLRGESWAV